MMVPQPRRSAEQLVTSGDTQDHGTGLTTNGLQENVAAQPRGRQQQRRGRGLTINERLTKLRAQGTPLQIHFARQFDKVCGRHASIFKSEVTVCIRQEAPLRVMNWRQMETTFPGSTTAIWNFLRDKFPEISNADHDYVMRQVERQYNVRRHRLYKIYRTIRQRPSDVAPEDWNWLIDNLWSNANFQKRSNQNSQNRSQQEMKSLVGTKSIAQIAYELRDPETGDWPSAMDVWKAMYQKSDGTWSLPNGEQILVNLQTVAETEQEKISSAAVPLVEHFALVLGRKANHSRGVGVPAVTQVAQERLRLHAQAEMAQQIANKAQEHAASLEAEVQQLTQANMQLREELDSQREELASQRKCVEARNVDMERLMDQKLEERMNSYIARIATAHASTN